MHQHGSKIGILAYGSLINDTGAELLPLIEKRIECITPFQVEYARISKTRGNAPTLIPVKTGEGGYVKAQILVLKPDVNIDVAKDMLWRRETRRSNPAEKYKEPQPTNKNAVSIKELSDFEGIDTVIYTSIPSNMGALNSENILAKFAIESILSEAGNNALDGIRYLQSAINNGISTPKSKGYEAEILKATGSKNLQAAINKLDTARPAYLNTLKDLEDFEKQISEISDYAFQYGVNTTIPEEPEDAKTLIQLIQERRSEFVKNCHWGFKKAQNSIVDLIIDIQENIEQNNIKIREYRRRRNVSGFKSLEQENKRLDFKEKILRHIIDGIAWQMIDGQLYIARRLYQEVQGTKVLKYSNLKSVIAAAKPINEDEQSFALISDLSGYIQIGDLLCNRNGQLQVIELKEGSHNLKIMNVAHEIMSGKDNFETILDKFQLDKKSVEQLNRQIKQYAAGQNLANIINHDEGFDSTTGEPFKVFTPEESTPRFDKELIAIRKQLETRNLWGYDVIDDCLHVGMYKGDFKFIGEKLLKSIVGHHTKNYIFMDLRAVMSSLNRPIFFLPFSKEFIFDIVFGRIQVLFVLDLDKYIELYHGAGYKAGWGSRKETMKAKEATGMGKNLLSIDNRGIKVELAKGDMWLAYGSILKIFFEFIYPSYMVYATKYYDGSELEGESEEVLR